MDSMDEYYGSVVVALLVLAITIVLYIWRSRSTRTNTILLVGLSDSGKTLIFSQLVTGRSVETFTSLRENIYPCLKLTRNTVRLVDVPGADRLRSKLEDDWLGKQAGTIKGVIFVVDSATFSKRTSDVAHFLYDVIVRCPKRVPILIACNKQDYQLAKSVQAIKSALEREFSIINTSRSSASAQLDSIDGSGNVRKHLLLGKAGSVDFAWSDMIMVHQRRVDFIECCAIDGVDASTHNIGEIQQWINAL